MPGFVIAVGCAAHHNEALVEAFTRVWPTATVRRAGSAVMVAHAFAPHAGMYELGGRVHVIDGEYAAYGALARRARETAERGDAATFAAWQHVPSEAACSIATVDTVSGDVSLRLDWTGTFPVYVTSLGRGTVLSTLLRPVAAAAHAEPDLVAVAQYLRSGYMVGERSLFRGVRRLQPGEVCRVTGGGSSVTTSDGSRAWAGGATDGDGDRTADAAWDALGATVAGSREAAPLAVMLSAGWDSRTLLAALLAQRDPSSLLAYSHGDLRSREMGLVRDIALGQRITPLLQPLDPSMYGAAELGEAFARTEAVLFPHWVRAGRVLAAAGSRVATAGVYGEVLGGHYGPSALEPRGIRQMQRVATEMLGGRGTTRALADPVELADRITARLRPRGTDLATGDLAADRPETAAELRADVAAAIDRLVRRGVAGEAALVEAFLSEHRGSRYINTQVLALRAHMDVAVPFCREPVLAVASAVPLHRKIHNQLNRDILRRHAPSLLRYPSAATLVPAGAPIVLQEASRVLRRSVERVSWALHRRVPRAVDRPRYGWYNLDSCRAHGSLGEIVSDMRLGCWDRRRIDEQVRRLESGEPTVKAAPIVEALVKAYAVDLMLR